MTSDLDVTPGQPDHYRFQLTNTAGDAVRVRPVAVNSLEDWIGRIVRVEGASIVDGSLTIGAWQSAIVIIEVTVPTDARVGDLNTVSLRLESTEALAAPGTQPQSAPVSEPINTSRMADGSV
jgi:hypothetical protein